MKFSISDDIGEHLRSDWSDIPFIPSLRPSSKDRKDQDVNSPSGRGNLPHFSYHKFNSTYFKMKL